MFKSAELWPRSVGRSIFPMCICVSSFVAVLVQIAIRSCLWRTLTTAPQISFPSSNCSPIMASSWDWWRKVSWQKYTTMSISVFSRQNTYNYQMTRFTSHKRKRPGPLPREATLCQVAVYFVLTLDVSICRLGSILDLPILVQYLPWTNESPLLDSVYLGEPHYCINCQNY